MKLKLKKRAKAEEEFKKGDWVDDFYRGEEIPFENLRKYIGKLVVIDYSTESHPWYKLVEVVAVHENPADSIYDCLVFDDGSSKNGKVSRSFFGRNKYNHPVFVWEFNENGPTKVKKGRRK